MVGRVIATLAAFADVLALLALTGLLRGLAGLVLLAVAR
jgi:hypothetical protein